MSSRRRVTSHTLQNAQICLRPLVQITEEIWSIQKRWACCISIVVIRENGDNQKHICSKQNTRGEKSKNFNQLRLKPCGAWLQENCTQQSHPPLMGVSVNYHILGLEKGQDVLNTFRKIFISRKSIKRSTATHEIPLLTSPPILTSRQRNQCECFVTFPPLHDVGADFITEFQISPSFSLSLPSTKGRGGSALILSSGPFCQAEFYRTGFRSISDGLCSTFHKLPFSPLSQHRLFMLCLVNENIPFSCEGFLKHLISILFLIMSYS